MKFAVKLDLRQVQRFATDTQKKAIPAAASRALNKTLANVRTVASKEIREERALSAKVTKDALTIERATRQKLYGALVASGRPIPLSKYQARQGKRGVTVKVSPGGRKTVIHAGNKAFIVGKIGGHVFARETKSRLPIKKLYGPSIPSTFIKDKVINALKIAAGENWVKRFAEEMKFELSKRSR